MSYYNKTIGADIKLNSSGDISVGMNGDLELAINDTNIMQSSRNSVLFPKGYDVYEPQKGSLLHLFNSLPNIESIRYLAADEVATALKKNPKIEAVPEVTTKKDSETSYIIECKIKPISEDIIFNIVFPVRQ